MATTVAEPLPPSSSATHTYTYPPLIIVLTIVLLLFFFAGFFSIYFCRCFVQNLLCTWHFRRSSSNNNTTNPSGPTALSAAGNGLDPKIVESFPSFTYSTVKDYTREKYGLECAICLVEFRSSDVLRLLTSCCHVFHRECIDLWLESHRTCPVCRRDLNSPLQTPVKTPANVVVNDDAAPQDSCSVAIKDDDQEAEEEEEVEEEKQSNNDREKFTRSHSTGHSIRSGDDRFTLILPEEVKSSIINGHNSSKSCTNFGEYEDKSRRNGSDAEASGVAAGEDIV